MGRELTRLIRQQLDGGARKQARRLFETPEQQIAEVFRAESGRRGPGGGKRPLMVVR